MSKFKLLKTLFNVYYGILKMFCSFHLLNVYIVINNTDCFVNAGPNTGKRVSIHFLRFYFVNNFVILYSCLYVKEK